METASETDWLHLKNELANASKSLGIDQIGFAAAEPFLELKQILLRHRELGRESGFEEPDIEKRTHPALSLSRPRSIIAIAIGYPSKLQDAPRSVPGAYRGMLSRSAWGEDYHHVLRKRLDRLEAWLMERVSGVRALSMVDTGVLVDRAVAERAGIGWVGKNCSVISPTMGSWIYLGEMITNLPLPPDKPVTEDCGDCTICIDACPTGALVGPGELHAGSCISYLTQTKTILPDRFKKKLGNRLYGCDTCQIVCPKNKGKNWTHHDELQPDPEQVKPLLKPILEMSNRQFKEKFGSSAAAWRGKKPIERNSIIALGHFRDESSVSLLREKLAKDPRPEIREAAAWSLGQIGTSEARNALAAAQDQEDTDEVLEAIVRALQPEAREAIHRED
ncbi:tRNA epoxyqueuosine(34) reductase QueG [Marinicrinis sediminis]|uniref:tRNA epoxyqueuosine(34) reductase QueG n=1 Tax=Marinicrinis sediminis TaxID=1652465 RepID=A0ABW5RF49_9BACL